MSRRKRKHAQYAEDDAANWRAGTNDIAIGSTLAHLQAQRQEGPRSHDRKEQSNDANNNDGWTVVGKGGKKQKTNNYPSLIYSHLHKQGSSITVHDLQSLVLYCIANGTSPQWISLRHHVGVKKAVVLFVPGLERGMFDGHGSPQDGKPGHGAVAAPKEEASYNVPSSIAVEQADSPDDFLPVRLAADNLPDPMKPLADCFDYLWPVQAPGDNKFAKVHSPLHAMLNSPIPKSKEEKDAEKLRKGPNPVSNKYWQNKRTPLKAFVLSKDELRENDYVLHPAWFDTESEAAAESKRRDDAKQTSNFGWVDTDIANLKAGYVPEQDVEQGSLTGGHTVLALDCEMCKVDGADLALTRVSLVNWDGEVVMDELVKPDKPIVDYLTPWASSLSGMNAC